ncbi:hypothetical protein DIPPA_59665 [Diplonema papillatum]|nr:hypothetical protein DIPPA_59665 [Diplonema papillatum]
MVHARQLALAYVSCLVGVCGAAGVYEGLGGVSVAVDSLGGYTVSLDGQTWLLSPREGGEIEAWGSALTRGLWADKAGADPVWGKYTGCECTWTGAGNASVKTSILVLAERSGVVFRHEYPVSMKRPPSVPGDRNAVLAGFPQFVIGAASAESGFKNMLMWGDNLLTGSNVSFWYPPYYGGVDGGPVLLFNQGLRALMLGPTRNFVTSIHSSLNSRSVFTAGVMSSVGEVPAGHVHETLLQAGLGINSTASAWGAALLAKNDRSRVDASKDFVLSRLGYWTDNGAYYYRNSNGFNNSEEALRAVKRTAEARGIPLQYFQWDDWWYYQASDWSGMQIWQPRPEVFPSGMTNWLEEPLSLYMDAYNSDNIYINNSRYKWAKDGTNHSVPITRVFYDDLFRNGTQIGMKMFEQDWLSWHSEVSGLMTSDVSTGDAWLNAMGQAALAANVSLQWCMMIPSNVLKTTEVPAVTNGRASNDAIGYPPFHLVLGYSCMLLHIVGLYCSADNAWSNTTLAPQRTPDPTSDILIATLAAGPFGVSDEVNSFNKSLIMQTVRADGILLKPDRSAYAVDRGFAIGFSASIQKLPTPVYLWSTHSDVAAGARFSYFLALNTAGDIAISAVDVDERDVFGIGRYVAFNYFDPVASAARFGGFPAGPASYTIPKAPAPANQTAPQLGYGYHVVAPVLSGDWVFLGEKDKFITASRSRIVGLEATAAALTVTVELARGEPYNYMFVLPSSLSSPVLEVLSTSCPASICVMDQVCTVAITVSPTGSSTCALPPGRT